MYITYTYMIESISISEFRNLLASYIEKLRTRRGYKLRLLDRNKPVVTLANAAENEGKRASKAGAALLRAASLAEKIEPEDDSDDISSHVNRYLYGKK